AHGKCEDVLSDETVKEVYLGT
ncbi:MAG: hypothetical protein J7J68_01825, partial [Thermotogaceae bacterium]|nr:hypothetical protein [Thermotogaceae bacterium]